MARRIPSVGAFICHICKKGFTRRSTVQDPHFASCVRRNGNPQDLPWDAHPSCWAKGKDGPSGTRALGLGADKLSQEEDNLEIHEEKEEIEVLDGEVELLATREVLDEESEGNKEVEDTADATLIASDTSETSDWTPINNSLDCDLIYDSAECSGNSVTLQRQLWPAFPDKHGSPRRQVVPQLLSRKTMNQTANIPILASRKRAGMSDVEAMSMWDTWHSLLPAGGISKIKRPWAGHGEKARQQAVVWMAQDTYSALLERTNTFVQQLQLVALWRDISRGLGDAPGVAKIHDLLVEEIGEGGPLLLS